VVPREVRVEEAVVDASTAVESEIDGGEAMLTLVEQEVLEIGWGVHCCSPTPEVEYMDSESGGCITDAWFEE